MTEKLAIREVIENWALWRDAGDWERFRSVWTDDGHMMATWFQGSAADFIKVSIEGWKKASAFCTFWAERQSMCPASAPSPRPR
jgi:hypothetical protein